MGKAPNGTPKHPALTLDGAPFVPGRAVAAILNLLGNLPCTEVLTTRELASRLHMRPHPLTELRRTSRILLQFSLRWGKLCIWGNPDAISEAKRLIAAEGEGEV